MPIFLDQNGQGLVGFTLAASWAATYVAILIVMAVLLTANVIRNRRAAQIGLGDGGNAQLLKAIRIHGNFVESVPFAIAALVLMPLLSAPVWAVHLVGLVTIAGRIAHAIGLNRTRGASAGRVLGMILSLTILLVAAVLLLWLAWW